MTEHADKKTGMTRRAALAKLGLGAAAIYAAPTVTVLTATFVDFAPKPLVPEPSRVICHWKLWGIPGRSVIRGQAVTWKW